jgi:hypothetical protein
VANVVAPISNVVASKWARAADVINTPLSPVNAPCIFSGFSGSGHDLSSHAIALQQLSSIRTFSHFVCDITVT